MKIIILPISEHDQDHFKFQEQNMIVEYNYENHKIIPQKGDIMTADRERGEDFYYFKVQSRSFIWDKGEPNRIFLNVKRMHELRY